MLDYEILTTKREFPDDHHGYFAVIFDAATGKDVTYTTVKHTSNLAEEAALDLLQDLEDDELEDDCR